MASPIEAQTYRVGIIGGGRGGSGLLKFFSKADVVKVVFVVDPNPTAIAILAAKEAGIPTFAAAADAINTLPADLIFEVTGSKDVTDNVAALVANKTARLVPSDAARMVVQVIEENNARLRTDVTVEVENIKGEIQDSLDGSRNLVSRINQIMGSMQMLALNASIEAAKVGVHGKGFAVVADHMTKSVESVRKLTQEIEAVNVKIQQVSQEIDVVLERLK